MIKVGDWVRIKNNALYRNEKSKVENWVLKDLWKIHDININTDTYILGENMLGNVFVFLGNPISSKYIKKAGRFTRFIYKIKYYKN